MKVQIVSTNVMIYSFFFADLLWMSTEVQKSERRSFRGRQTACVFIYEEAAPTHHSSLLLLACISWIPKTFECGFHVPRLCPMISVSERKSWIVFQSVGCFLCVAQLLKLEKWQTCLCLTGGTPNLDRQEGECVTSSVNMFISSTCMKKLVQCPS